MQLRCNDERSPTFLVHGDSAVEDVRKFVTPFAVAIAIQPLLFAAYLIAEALLSPFVLSLKDFVGPFTLAPYVLVVAGLHALVAAPLVFVANRFGALGKWSLPAIGALVGAVPTALLGRPSDVVGGLSTGGNWHGSYRTLMESGVTTLDGRLLYFENVAMSAMFGLVGGIAFWFAWQRAKRKRAAE